MSFDVEKVAKIARIKLDDAEKKKLNEQLGQILKWSEQLDNSGEADYFTEKTNAFREDKVVPFNDAKLITANFKHVKKGKLIVPRGL